MGSVGRLLERVTLLPSKLASLRERSVCPLPRTKRAHQSPNVRMSANALSCHWRWTANAPVQESLAPRLLLATGAAITRPRDATKAKMIKDLKDMIVCFNLFLVKELLQGLSGSSK